MIDTAIYIHIPFCDHKCIYCDFYSIINYENTSRYLEAVKKEIANYAKQFAHNRKIISIFFGGGTPSLMEAGYLCEIIKEINTNFSVNDDAEITLETNPGTVSKAKLTDFKNAGINRISVGIQSFDDDDLKFLTRIHDSKTAKKTLYDASEAGFENLSLDLIFNLPNQTKEKWKKNLEESVALPIKHLSAYSLILEQGTILNKMVLDGKVKLQDVDYDADLYELTLEFLSANGFTQYEVSNFAKPGFQCIHNNAYWHYKEYLSFGTSAHSFANSKRWKNYSSARFYIDAVNKKGNAAASEEDLTKEQMLDEYVMLALRSAGLDLAELQNKFGNAWYQKNEKLIQKLITEKFLIPKRNKLALTSSGFAICDEILLKLE
ncbi:MAG: oxygen-independent coproporphyrinogen III oxidase [Ignavibacteria bacterium]|nr:MAG: oxygen-independent coproporphyrinogen III oxidase [Ignavibacteria bacterium]KAF0161445.1 MAG: oxygen-independent coproporphyrinogen III oxidase [Ignavibacteria bacterium]